MSSEHPSDNKWLSAQAVADRFDVPLRTIRAWRERGTGPAGVRFGKAVRYRLSEVERWEIEQEQAS
jgi:DNA-binding transcriptional MerR regulator